MGQDVGISNDHLNSATGEMSTTNNAMINSVTSDFLLFFYSHHVVYSNSNCRHFVDKYHLLNFDRLRYIAERADLGEHNEAIIAATIDEKPGSFLKFCQLLDNHTITEFNYRKRYKTSLPASARPPTI
jgi:hypothetical protein